MVTVVGAGENLRCPNPGQVGIPSGFVVQHLHGFLWDPVMWCYEEAPGGLAAVQRTQGRHMLLQDLMMVEEKVVLQDTLELGEPFSGHPQECLAGGKLGALGEGTWDHGGGKRDGIARALLHTLGHSVNTVGAHQGHLEGEVQAGVECYACE